MIIVSDNLQITCPSIQAAVRDRDPRPIRALCQKAAAAGAGALDVNAGPGGQNAGPGMAFFVETVQGAVDLPLWLDTTNPESMAAGLTACTGRAVVNGTSREPARLDAMVPLAMEHDADLVAFLLDEKGRVVPDTDGRLALAADLVQVLEKRGVSPDRVIIDPVVPPLLWEDGPAQARAVVDVLRLLPHVVGPEVRTVCGLSNLTTGGPADPARLLVESTFAAMLAGAGVTHLLANVFRTSTMATARTAGLLSSPSVFCWGEVPAAPAFTK